MDTLNFDGLGHLVPYDVIETNWESFVNAFGWNDSRHNLISQLTLFLSELDTLSIRTFTLWIDGSFCTQKEQPNDLDVVFVLPSALHRQFEQNLRKLRNQFDGLDLYFVRLIHEREQDYFLYSSDRAEWFFQFTKTKPDRVTRRKFPKGFIQITWSNESAVQTT